MEKVLLAHLKVNAPINLADRLCSIHHFNVLDRQDPSFLTERAGLQLSSLKPLLLSNILNHFFGINYTLKNAKLN